MTSEFGFIHFLQKTTPRDAKQHLNEKVLSENEIYKCFVALNILVKTDIFQDSITRD